MAKRNKAIKGEFVGYTTEGKPQFKLDDGSIVTLLGEPDDYRIKTRKHPKRDIQN